MKFASAIGAAALVGQAAAFPTAMEHIANNPVPAEKRQTGGINIGFDPKAQYVSTTGKYKFVAPKGSDLRGPCPGLNAAANHGYLPHNGYATIAQFIDGTFRVFGMAADLAGFLAVYGAIFDGDGLSWSIGGTAPTAITGPLGTILGTPNGISGSHNKYENDVSPTRGDLFLDGNNFRTQLDAFKQLYAYQEHETEETSNYDLGVLTAHRSQRFTRSLENNPYFFNAPFPGLEVQPAAFTFIFRFMANKSQEFPEGRLSQKVLKSFFAITGDTPDQFVYTEGYERIPDNWYKRAIGDEYSIPFFEVDLLAQAEQDPRFLDVGGNLGKGNTFTGVDIGNLTNGAFNTKTLAQGHNLNCFVYNAIISQGPDFLVGPTRDVVNAIAKVSGALKPFIKDFGCKKLDKQITGEDYDSAFNKFPGYAKLKANGQYKRQLARSENYLP